VRFIGSVPRTKTVTMFESGRNDRCLANAMKLHVGTTHII